VGLLAVLGAAPLFDASSTVEADELEIEWSEPDPEWAYIASALADLRQFGLDVEVVDSVMRDLGDDGVLALRGSVAIALLAEAGDVNVLASGAVSELVGPWLPVSEAIHREAGAVDVARAVLEELGESSLPILDAVAGEAGEVDVASVVLATLGSDELMVVDAVRAEAGSVDIAAVVLAATGDTALPVAAAVATEAGSVDVAAPVQRRLRESALPSVLVDAPKVPEAANPRWSRGWGWAAAALAAVAMVAVGIAQMGSVAPEEMVFAGAGELVVEDLEYADDVVVMQAEGDEGAGEDDLGGAGAAGHALACEHEGQHDGDLLADAEFDAGGLGDEDGGDGEVEGGAVEIEGVAHGHDEGDDALGDTEGD
jgi:hypothetical protein